jgi:hypothetical protein
MAMLELMQDRELKKITDKAKADANFSGDVLARFNKSKSKTLKFEELRCWLKSIALSQSIISASYARNELDQSFPGCKSALSLLCMRESIVGHRGSLVNSVQTEFMVTDYEVAWVMMMAMDKGSINQMIKSKEANLKGKQIDVKDLELRPSHFCAALRAWLSYIHNKSTLGKVLKKYGTNELGQMERSGVKCMLQDLSGGREPEEAELDSVIADAQAMPHADGISGPELINVLSLWYTKELERESQERVAEVASHKGCGSSTCCIS